MNRRFFILFAFVIGTLSATSQGLEDMQIHGFATQAFVASNQNNYLGMDTASFTSAWTEAAININDSVSDRLRVGVQLHYTRLGAFGGDNVAVDWALGDYRINQYAGVRAGKVKIRWGLYNDTQDYDPGYLWSLLPESIYGIDVRATNLSQLGAELYGKISLPRNLGKVGYSAYYGSYYYASNDGYIESLNEQGLTFSKNPSGKTPGADLRWDTPAKGLKVGGSIMVFNAKGNLVSGTYYSPYTYWPTAYAQYEFKKVFASGQYAKIVTYQTVTIPGSPAATSGSDSRTWFLMGGYHFTDKFQSGVYYDSDELASSHALSDPANYFHEVVVSSRYDVNSNFYGKLEGHHIDGNAIGFYGFNNPKGLKPTTDFLVAKIGFTF